MDTFADFIQRVRGGDADAAVELVRKHEAIIRREVRLRLSDPALLRVFDSMDICQSVLASFFVRAASGQYELESPGHLLKLLLGMARHKLKHQVRKQRAQRRDHRRLAAASVEEFMPADSVPTPSQLVAGKELLHEFQSRLTPEERQLADLRALGRSWAEIAAEMGGSAEARRKQLTRGLDRIGQELGLDEADE